MMENLIDPGSTRSRSSSTRRHRYDNFEDYYDRNRIKATIKADK